MNRCLIVQPGARHDYALARFLHERGMLQRLYTDFAIGVGNPLRALQALPLPGGLRDRLRRRTTDALPARLICSGSSVRVPGLGERALRRPSDADITASDGCYLQYFTGGADIRRRARGKPIISDVFIVPHAYRTVDAEIAAFPDWGEEVTPPAVARRYDAHSRTMFEQSDLLFCPSQAVIDAVAGYGGAYAAKCRLVPYGASLQATPGRPEPGRILFCGSLQLRKGVQYIRTAAKALEARHPHVRFVFAGSGPSAMRAKLAAPNIELLGQLGREALAAEYARADIFLFPSLAEGAAGTVLEAMASGLPVVGTRAAGVDFTDGESGILIPPRDPEAIAAAVLRLCENRPLRDAMAAGALRESRRYSMGAWEARFVAAVAAA